MCLPNVKVIMPKENPQQFIERKRKDAWANQKQLDCFIQVLEYCKKEVPGLPEPIATVSDGDSYGLFWNHIGPNNKSLSIDVFNYDDGSAMCWIFHSENESALWDEFTEDSEADTLPSTNLIYYLKKLVS